MPKVVTTNAPEEAAVTLIFTAHVAVDRQALLKITDVEQRSKAMMAVYTDAKRPMRLRFAQYPDIQVIDPLEGTASAIVSAAVKTWRLFLANEADLLDDGRVTIQTNDLRWSFAIL